MKLESDENEVVFLSIEAQINKLCEENKRLRTALETIASGISYDLLGLTSMSREDMQSAAKEALNFKE